MIGSTEVQNSCFQTIQSQPLTENFKLLFYFADSEISKPGWQFFPHEQGVHTTNSPPTTRKTPTNENPINDPSNNPATTSGAQAEVIDLTAEVRNYRN